MPSLFSEVPISLTHFVSTRSARMSFPPSFYAMVVKPFSNCKPDELSSKDQLDLLNPVDPLHYQGIDHYGFLPQIIVYV
ncbi:hypothetical protein IQ07DRAFT_146498 [Pyrenochaeta sp. DS3sAY3a]|nr:hypothetical protein IQ07DRAFT_146498 [Pyrenochaeta sp. DS3sAY3a]